MKLHIYVLSVYMYISISLDTRSLYSLGTNSFSNFNTGNCDSTLNLPCHLDTFKIETHFSV